MASEEQFHDRIIDSGAPSVPQLASDQSVSKDDLKQERDHFIRIVNAFLYYR